ncbi:DnaJ domain-containing protein [Catenaria anguillulae PL171]|uniref:DnaJ domain-containing protein n=1 Tax=Catenaria anguillulae PL171 TaxID=765915 RepID=A0A1Y2HHF4_9FUNG|nr:DnaJ domain-containing protein [Catenaria anguillulae PL171]
MATVTNPTAVSLYDVLELRPGAHKRDIKAAYYRLSKVYHPDVNDSPEAHTKFLAISDAYATLGNDLKRREYDRTRISRSTQHMAHSPHGRHSRQGPAGGTMRNQRTYGAYDPSGSWTGGAKGAGGAGGKRAGFDYDAHYWEHYGREEAEIRGQRTMNNARHQQREEAKRREEWEQWQAELSRGRSDTNHAFGLGVALSSVLLGVAFWNQF